MGKKKKKKSNTPQTRNDDDNNNPVETSITTATQDMMRLRLLQKPSSSLLSSPGKSSYNNNNNNNNKRSGDEASKTVQVLLTETDGYRLGVYAEDQVILLATSPTDDDDDDENPYNDDIIRTLICKVKIQGNNSNKSKNVSGTPSPLGKQRAGGKGQNHLSPGCCQVIPYSIIQSWFDDNSSNDDNGDNNDDNKTRKDNDDATEATPTPITATVTPSSSSTPSATLRTPSVTNTPYSSASPSKSNFSFAMGGGGDLLITPPSRQQQRQQRTPFSNNNSNNKSKQSNRSSPVPSSFSFWAIPLHCALGKEISNLICKDLYQINVKTPIATTTGPSPSSFSSYHNNKQMLKRLILAHYVDPYVFIIPKHPQLLSISFQGKPLSLEVHSIIANKKTNKIINNSNTQLQQQRQQQQEENVCNNINDEEEKSSPSLEEQLSEKLRLDDNSDDADYDDQERIESGTQTSTKEQQSSSALLLKSIKRRIVSEDDDKNHSGSSTIKALSARKSLLSSSLFVYKLTYDTKIAFVSSSLSKNNNNDSNKDNELEKEEGDKQQHQQEQSEEEKERSYNDQSTTIMKAQLKQETEKQQYVAGLESVLKKVKTLLLTPLLRPELFKGSMNHSSRSSLTAPKGVLLYGPSGVGKTCLSQQIMHDIQQQQEEEEETEGDDYHNNNSNSKYNNNKNNNNIRIQYVNCASLQSHTAHVGEAEQQLLSLWRGGKMDDGESSSSRNGDGGGTLLILDDIHLICPRRGSSGGGGIGLDRLASTLLALMDGIDSKGGGSTKKQQQQNDAHRTVSRRKNRRIVILAITTNPSLLDPALRRPGRLDTEIEIPIPEDASARYQILKFQLQQTLSGYNDDTRNGNGSSGSKILLSDDQFMELAKQAKGFTGADCMLAIKEAFRSAIVRSHTYRNTAGKGTDEAATPAVIVPQPSSSSSSSSLVLLFEDLQKAIGNIKPSSIKAVSVEIPKVYWTDIGGMDSVKKQLIDSIELPMKYGDLLAQLNIPPPRGILLYGPPGCSKTLMARALATCSNMNFLAVKGPELLSKWLGESERTLASLFKRARMASPCIIFFDEMDAIASKRSGMGDSGGGGGGGGRLLSQLLTELDGIQTSSSFSSGSSGNSFQKERVIVVGATNRPDLLDNALMRPGRMDKKIYVGIPDEPSRTKIFEIGLKNKSCSRDVDIKKLASDDVSKGFSGAELIAICRDSALLALEETEAINESRKNNISHTEESINASTTSERLLLHQQEQQQENDTLLPMIQMQHLLDALYSMERQITPEMLSFYDSFQKATTNN